MRKLIGSLFGAPINRYFRFGVRYLVKVPSVFAREIALEQAMEYIRYCQVPGDYLEFGVWKGRTFSAACFLARERGLDMQHWAFDSFEGLPSSEGEFQKGAFRATQDTFLLNVRKCIGDINNVHVVPGWFSDSLKEGNIRLRGLSKVAIAWVDCDLYESTTPVLDFLTDRLQDGSLIFFDDWFCLKGRDDSGEQRACREWLERNPQIRLTDYGNVGWHGKSFIAHVTKQPARASVKAKDVNL